MREKRQHARKPVDLPAILVVEGDPTPWGAHARDMSIGGVFVETDVRPAFGTRVTLTIAFEGMADALELPAIVRWSSPEGLGLQFGLLGARETHAIAAAISAAR